MFEVKDILKCILFIISIGACFIALVYGFIKLEDYAENIRNKKECNEIYVTDNVILKKCQKYFDEVE